MSRTLLVADDSVTIQKVVELTFSDSGYRVVGVGDGKAALETARELRPDLVLCDVIMPEMNGYEVCQQIKADPLTAQTPVLLLTGAFEPFDEDRAGACGADGHLTKPFESRALLSRVEELLGGSEPAGGSAVEFPAAGAVAEAESAPFAAEAGPTLGEVLPGALEESEAETIDPAGWGQEGEPESLVFEPPPPAAESEPGPVFTPAPEAPEAPAMGLPDSEDWLEPEAPEVPSASSAGAVFPPELEVGEPVADREVAPPSLDENPIVLEEEPATPPAAPFYPASEGPVRPSPAPDSPAPFDLAHALADPDLRRMVEDAVERVVRDVVREVAWEIVPDLTETLIRRAARGKE
jgi:CheY-like chemotaxis protein